ncbi:MULTISPECIES: PIG-L deacetylase family protein [unclassified Pseudofrankia]|uniref:PIG-L deacetylase family protein n=1 Tax=unclassified Pseudofrankia TaxID=2994372 RepID=UPI0008DA9E5C|nr:MULTISPECIES: PIG-L family deacetylase [unclassified Pseudofrankia]MDT3442737.1 PIG-L family deacetylase [Pseudofrankia sp. BMG5.37]OHV44195.1 GlcNAc-PI de-N-acetylase [Pseudofrankia sp. BMG5.36]
MGSVVALHAHPDDEALWSGGTLALLAAAGHRVVIVVATDGHMGNGSDPEARVRLDELRASAAELGVARVEYLGYADSGHGPLFYPDPDDRQRFARADLDEAAGKLAGLLRAEKASVLISYDARGGYGHRDHVRVHEVGARAADLAGGIRTVEATLPRETVERLVRIGRLGALFRPARPAQRPRPFRLRRQAAAAEEPAPPMFTPRREIAYRVDVRRYARQKRASLAAHASQLAGPRAPARLRRYVTRLPVPLFALLGGREYFNDPSATPAASFLDVFTDAD